MPIRSSHSRPRPEVPRPAELPAGVPVPARPAPTRDSGGRFARGDGTTALARAGGKAAHESRQLGKLLGLWTPPEEHAYAPYARLAREWRDGHMARLAETVGGGEVGPGPASIVSSAALQLAASRWLADRGAEACSAKMLLDAARLADASRANLLAAHELCAREANLRKNAPGQVPAWRQRIAEQMARDREARGSSGSD